ncbi:MAG: hypothetical protein WD226_03505 [Planctomycetota bacterium]
MVRHDALVPDAATFRMLPQFRERALHAANRGYISERSARAFPGDGLHERFARALGARKAVRFKEVLEAIEFFAVVRKRVRRPVMVDLCAGHGLVGILFAMYERSVERVVLVEPTPPGNRSRVLEAAAEVAPWVPAKLELVNERVEHVSDRLVTAHPGAALVAVHACGLLTDRAIELGTRLGGPLGLLPCCRPHSRSPAPAGLALALGADVAFDVDRTYRLERAGYSVRWTDVPAAITPMNRVLVAWPRADGASASGEEARAEIRRDDRAAGG